MLGKGLSKFMREVPPGAVLLFESDTALSGYTLLTNKDDMVIYVTKGSGAGGEAGGSDKTGGTWTQPNHALTLAQLAAHAHYSGLRWNSAYTSDIAKYGVTTESSVQRASDWVCGSGNCKRAKSATEGSGNNHNHGTAYRPLGRNFTRQRKL